jgi:hypothetical protein
MMLTVQSNDLEDGVRNVQIAHTPVNQNNQGL